jgi:hypothetical protein
MIRRAFIVVFCALPFLIDAQPRIENDEYFKEFIYGINKNTNGGLIGGFFLRYSRKKNDSFYETFGIELLNVKHPKEIKYSSQQTGTSFIWGKQNYLYSIRTHYGYDKILYRKAPQQGVQINANIAGGPTLGIVSPYYVFTQGGEYRKFDPDLFNQLNQIQGPGKLFQGLGESELVPGIKARASLAFEFGTFRNNVTGVELGVSAEAFTKEIILVPTQENRALFTAAFITVFWGTRK